MSATTHREAELMFESKDNLQLTSGCYSGILKNEGVGPRRVGAISRASNRTLTSRVWVGYSEENELIYDFGEKREKHELWTQDTMRK